jgi:uncharacterized protein YjbI with pentapeptide repeats
MAPNGPKEISPAIAAKADDLAEIKKSVEDAASVSGGLWLSYLFVLFYIAIAAGAVTHADLLLQNTVKLPFLNVELPLLAFFAVAPFVVLIIHVYALMHFIMLGKKPRVFTMRCMPSFDRSARRKSPQRAKLISRRLCVFGLGIATIWLSFMLATIPNEWQSGPLSYVAEIEPKALNELVFGTVDARTATVTGSWPANTLRLQGFDIYEALKVDDPKKLDWKDHTFDLHSRRLEGAVIGRAKLGKVDLKEAHLEGALMSEAKLQGALLDKAEPQGALLEKAELQGASLNGAQLQGARLEAARLQGASLSGAKLQGARLIAAELQGADLGGAELQGASLVGAQLQGAAFSGAELLGASFEGAAVNAADFSRAFLWRTNWAEGLAALLSTYVLGARPPIFGSVQLDASLERWKPVWKEVPNSRFVLWDAKAYAELRDFMIKSIPKGEMRDDALKRIEILDCANCTEPAFEKACGSKERVGAIQSAFYSYFQKFDFELALNVYVFCLSEHDPQHPDGRLSMWRAYGGNGDGVALVFKTDFITFNKDSPLLIAKVIYASEEHRIQWLRGIFAAALLILNQIPDDKLYIAAHQISPAC